MTRIILIVAFVLSLVFLGCKKQETTTPPSLAEFTTSTNTASYFIPNDPNSVYKIPVGFTTASNNARTVNYTVSSPTGATAGTQYTILSSGSVTIPAGKTVDSISVKGLFAGYPTGRRDTLIFKITGGDALPSSWSNTFNLVLQKFCPVSLPVFTGTYIAQDYDATTNLPDGGAYTLTITPGTTTGNTGTVSIAGLWGIPNPFTVALNWTNAANFTTSIADQNWFVHTTYGQAKIKSAGGNGTFSSCDNTLLIRYDAYVSLGSFGTYYTTLRK
ncbi:MAG: hypothetical protein V4676_12985 [Bacteroidota bacterium]